jgi:RIMS-binding protein 2
MDNSAEVPFSQGDLIRVFGEKDADGFYYGEVNDRRGLIPGNMVKEVQIDDAHVAREIMSDGNGMLLGNNSSRMMPRAGGSNNPAGQHQQQQHHPSDRSADIYEDMPMRRMVAAYDYDPQQSSPNVDSDVSCWLVTDRHDDG